MDKNSRPARDPLLPLLHRVAVWIDVLSSVLPVLGFSWIVVSPFGGTSSKVSDVPALAVISGVSLWVLSKILTSVAHDPYRYFSKLPRVNEKDKRFGEHVVVLAGINLTVLTGLLMTSYQESFDVVFYSFLSVYVLTISAYLYIAYVRKKILLAMSEEMHHT